MLFYTITHPDERVDSTSVSGGLDVSTSDILNDNGTANPISSPADVLSLDLHFEGEDATRRATEMDELLNSVSVAPIPLTTTHEPSISGYYAAESTSRSMTLSPEDGNGYQSLRVGTLRKVGTRSSHYRAVYTRPTQPDPGNIFGNDTTALVGIPSESTRVAWYDRSFADHEPASVQETVTTADGDVDRYDARDVGELGEDPVLVYRPPEPEGQTDVGVWDTYGSDDEAGWARVYNVDHVPRVDDELVIENGLVRLWLADGPAALAADEWDPSAEEWSEISLVDTDWELVETDLTRIGAVAVEAQCVFTDGEEEFAVDVRLERGYDRPQFLLPTTEPMPAGLEELLEPIANESAYVTKATLGLVARKELRR